MRVTITITKDLYLETAIKVNQVIESVGRSVQAKLDVTDAIWSAAVKATAGTIQHSVNSVKKVVGLVPRFNLAQLSSTV